MARRISRKSMKQDEFIEAAFDAGQWLEENWKTVAMGVAAVVAAVLLGYAWMAWSARRASAAAAVFDEGYGLYTAAQVDGQATDPRYGEALGHFEEAASRAGRAPLSDVAILYQGLSHLRSGDPAQAVPEFERVAESTDNGVMRSTAKANLAEALSDNGEIDRAAEVWRELAAAETAYYPKEHALLNLGQLLAEAGRGTEARDVLREVVDDYSQTTSGRTAQTVLDGLDSDQ